MRTLIVHDYLTQRGGAERVVLEMARAFPGATILTSVYAPERTFQEFKELDVATLWLQRAPFLPREPRLALPLLADVFRRQKIDADLVLCSTSGFAHLVSTDAPKIVYCHNPPRWLHQWDEYRIGLNRPTRALVRALRPRQLKLDRTGARAATCYIANSQNVAERVRRTYDVEALVVHPPRGLAPDGPMEHPAARLPERYLLTVGRPRGYKRTDLLMRAVAAMPELHLVTVGVRPQKGWPPNIHQLVDVSDAELRWLYAHASGLLACSFEDFGLTPVEAFGFGLPVAATQEGGYLETCEEGRTGVWLEASSMESLRASIRDFVSRSWDSEAIRTHGQRWTPSTFHSQLQAVVDEVTARSGNEAAVPEGKRWEAP